MTARRPPSAAGVRAVRLVFRDQRGRVGDRGGWVCWFPDPGGAHCLRTDSNSVGLRPPGFVLQDPFGEDENDLPLDPMGDALKADIEVTNNRLCLCRPCAVLLSPCMQPVCVCVSVLFVVLVCVLNNLAHRNSGSRAHGRFSADRLLAGRSVRWRWPRSRWTTSSCTGRRSTSLRAGGASWRMRG